MVAQRFIADCMQAVNGSTPRANTVLEVLVAPVVVLGSWAFTVYMDYVVRSSRAKKQQ
jgi:hypothetical protein